MELKPRPYWPFNREKRQFYFVDSVGKQLRCRQTLWGRFISLFRKG